MERPLSIVWFERCYLACVALGLVATTLNWNAALAKLSENPQMEQFGSSFGSNMLIGGIVINLLVSALLWYFTARKASVVTKWFVTVFFVLNLLFSVLGLVRGGSGMGVVSHVISVAALVLNGIAVWQLFKPDARAWFGETSTS